MSKRAPGGSDTMVGSITAATDHPDAALAWSVRRSHSSPFQCCIGIGLWLLHLLLSLVVSTRSRRIGVLPTFDACVFFIFDTVGLVDTFNGSLIIDCLFVCCGVRRLRLESSVIPSLFCHREATLWTWAGVLLCVTRVGRECSCCSSAVFYV